MKGIGQPSIVSGRRYPAPQTSRGFLALRERFCSCFVRVNLLSRVRDETNTFSNPDRPSSRLTRRSHFLSQLPEVRNNGHQLTQYLLALIDQPAGAYIVEDNRPNIEHRPTNSLRPYPGNARAHNKKQIKQIADSIVRFGFTNPVLISDDGQIIAGHGR